MGSGGPLVTANPDLYEVIGVVSFGVGCALADYPGVYARVSKQLEWIGANTEGSWNTCARCPPGETCETPVPVPAPAPAPAPGPTTTGEGATCDAGWPSGHTMDIFYGPSDECAAKTMMSGFDGLGISRIVDRHNELRQKVVSGMETNGDQPGASDMLKMTGTSVTEHMWDRTPILLGTHKNPPGKALWIPWAMLSKLGMTRCLTPDSPTQISAPSCSA